jgi:pimeloyl-ACP methyl ester carboxylesterase
VPPVQYVKSGDAYIAYQVIGSGAIDILSINGFISHLECAWEQPRYRHTIAQLSRMGRVILVDKRGFGLSDRVLDSPTLEQVAGDIKAVLDAVGSQSAIVVSGCEGAMAACFSTMLFPQQVHGLVLVNALAKGSRAPGFPWAMPFDTYEYIFENVRQEWGGPFALDFFVPNSDKTDKAFRQWWAKFVRLAASPGTALKAVQLMREMDMTELLPQVSAPTLVLHARDNRVVRVGSGRFIASQIPKAQYIEIVDDCHLWWWNSDAYLAEIACFIKRLHGHQDSHCA